MMKKNIKTNLIALSAFFGLASASSAVTLLVDFGPGTQTESSASDFALADSTVDTSAIVNEVVAATDVIVAGVGVDAVVSVNTGGVFQAGATPATGPNGILIDYIFGNNADPSVTVSGLEEIATGTALTLTVYSHGDQAAQVADIIFTEGGNSTTSDVTTGEIPFATFNFTKQDGVDEFTIVVDNGGEGNNFAAINGFSLTAPVPEPSSTLLLGLGSLGLLARRRRA